MRTMINKFDKLVALYLLDPSSKLMIKFRYGIIWAKYKKKTLKNIYLIHFAVKIL